jgi:hypothetical protein
MGIFGRAAKPKKKIFPDNPQNRAKGDIDDISALLI